MKNTHIYTLRHEQRPLDNSTYFVSLTEIGLKNSEILSLELSEIDFDEIYCSPFLRTIQTVIPYLKQNLKTKLKIEYALYEHIDQTIFNSYTFRHHHTELYKDYPEFKHYIDDSYQPYLSCDQLQYKEFINEMYNRIIPFVTHIKNSTNKKILLVSHGTTINIIKKYLIDNKKYTENDEKKGNYPNMGKLDFCVSL